MKNMRKLVLAACLLVANANREAYGNWETYLNKHDRTSDTPFWKNYENWNQWVTEETPADLTPSKNGLDSWRKWNLGKMETYGENWQNTFEPRPEQESRQNEFEKAPKQGTDEWKEWMKTRFVEANNLMSRPNHRVEKDYPVSEKEKQPFGPYHHPKEVPDVKDPTNSNQDDWQEMIPAAYRVSAPADNDFAERYNDKHSPHNKPRHSDKNPKKEKEAEDYSKFGEEYAKKYTDENAKYAEKYGGVNPNGGGSSPDDISKYTDWKKYVGGEAGNDWNRYIPGSNPPGGGGGGGRTVNSGPDGWENYGGGSYTDWKKFAGGYGPPMTLIAKPKPNHSEPNHSKPSQPTSHDNNGQPVDWHKYVPEAYRDFVPSDETINEANKNNAAGQPVDWRGFVPQAFRHYIPDNATIAEQEKGQVEGRNHGSGGGGNQESSTSTSKEVIIIVPQPEDVSSAKIGSHIQGEQEGRPEKSKEDRHPKREKPNHHNDQSTAKLGSKIQHDQEPHHLKKTEKACNNPKCGKSCECDKNCECRKDKPESEQLAAQSEQLATQSEQLATSNLASAHPLPKTTTWSGVAIGFLSVTILVGLFVGGYLFKRLKKRHYDYEQVAELDADQLLLV